MATTAARTAPQSPAGPPAAGKPATTSRMSLVSIQKGPLVEPDRIVFYGPPGVGKTTWAAGAPDPIFLPVEAGSGQLDVARFPQPVTYLEALAAVNELGTQAHDYRTLVIDTGTALEALIWKHVQDLAKDSGHTKGKINYVTDVQSGYSAGYKAAVEEWRRFLARLERLREVKRMHVIILCHSTIKPFKNPDGDDYDHHTLQLDDKIVPVLQEWPDCLLFADFRVEVKGKKGRKGKATGAPVRIVRTTRTPTADAKNRYGLPPLLAMDFMDYSVARANHQPASPETLTEQIKVILQQLDPVADAEIVTWTEGEIAKSPSAVRLARIVDRLGGIIAQRAQPEEDGDE